MVPSLIVAEESATDNYETGQDRLKQILSHVGDKSSFFVTEAVSPNLHTICLEVMHVLSLTILDNVLEHNPEEHPKHILKQVSRNHMVVILEVIWVVEYSECCTEASKELMVSHAKN